MVYVKDFLALLGLGVLLGVVLASVNNRLLLPRHAGESIRALGYVFFIVLGLALAGVAGIERTYKGLFDDVTEQIRPLVNEGLLAVGLDPARVPVGEVGRMLEVVDNAFNREIARQDAEWFLEFLEPWQFSALLESGRGLAQALRRLDTVDTDWVFLLAKDASFAYFFPLAGPAFWALLALFPFFALLLWVSAGRANVKESALQERGGS